MLNVGALHEGFVLDHIKAGKAMTIYHDLKLDKLDCTVAIIKNAKSNKMGVKDIIKVECPIENLDLDILGFIDHNITVNIIKDEKIVEKRILKLPKQMMPAALNAVNGIPRAVDIGRFCEDSYFAYVAGFGAFTEVSYMTPQDKKNLLGHQAYILEGVKSLASIKSYVMKVTSPAETIEGEFIYGMVTNTVSVGGFKGLINQNVSLSDGLFEVLLIRMPKTPLEFSSIVTGLLMREEETSDLIYKFKASELHIEAQEPVDWVLDGEFGGSKTAVSIRNLPRQIEILCPEPGKERKYAV